jgi:ACS family glucarate transporter-like MFS transporter
MQCCCMPRAFARITPRIRWRIFAFLFAFGLIAYVQRTGVTVAAERMMPELHLSQLQIGLIEQAFVIGYALFQLPGGLLGQRFGARAAFTAFGIVAFAAVMATPAAPELFNGAALFTVLLGAQFLLGIAQAGIFPVSNGVFEAWFPARQWALALGAQNMGLNLGAALTPPLIAVLMSAVGWQQALAWSSIPPVVVIALWVWYARNSPREHPAVSSAELAELGDEGAQTPVDDKVTVRRLLRLLGHRSTLLLALSYLAMNYSFFLLSNWCFLYLIQERHFSVLQSGWLAMLPPIVAGVGSGVGGVTTGWLCKRFGATWGYRGVPLVALPLVGVLLLIAVETSNAFVAVAALTGCFGFVEINEAAYWAASMAVGRSDSMATGGVLNTGGSLGGIIGIPVVAYLSGRHAWGAAFAIGSACAVAAALLWLGIDADQTVTSRSGARAEAGAPIAG